MGSTADAGAARTTAKRAALAAILPFAIALVFVACGHDGRQVVGTQSEPEAIDPTTTTVDPTTVATDPVATDPVATDPALAAFLAGLAAPRAQPTAPATTVLGDPAPSAGVDGTTRFTPPPPKQWTPPSPGGGTLPPPESAFGPHDGTLPPEPTPTSTVWAMPGPDGPIPVPPPP
jgi:hypothetical protein